MDPYRLALFCHVLAAVGLFVELAVEWLSVRHLRASTCASWFVLPIRVEADMLEQLVERVEDASVERTTRERAS